ncbi:MAG TPA: NAD-dependent epimerase/dehydratase family protein [Rhodospirillales bacterium]
MTTLVTGAAGFIGFHVSLALLGRGEPVVGVDSVNDYYDPTLKEARLKVLGEHKGFRFERLDHFAFASSSSVYGGNTKLPFSINDRVDTPLSLYAATKRAGELMAHAFAHVHGVPLTGLRFFTVYGPWGRPDMAAFIFIGKILAGQPIPVFNDGDMSRDFTYIDDIVAGVLACLERPPVAAAGRPPFALYNLGNNVAEPLMRFISVLEKALGKKAEIAFEPMQIGDVKETYADIAESERDFGFKPTTPIDVGLPKLVAWYRDYYKV